jgi:hypothetical protein
MIFANLSAIETNRAISLASLPQLDKDQGCNLIELYIKHRKGVEVTVRVDPGMNEVLKYKQAVSVASHYFTNR